MQNVPGYSENSVIISHQGFTSASTGLVLKLRQEAYPENSMNNTDFSIACGEIISNIPRLCFDDATQSRASIIYIQMGKQNFVKAPDQAEIRIRFLSMNDTHLEKITEIALEFIHGICHLHHLEYTHSFTDSFPGLESSPDALEIIKSVAAKKGLDLIEIEKAFSWSEDFGHFAQISPIAMFGLGAGLNHHELGSIHYDFPDKLIGSAIDFLVAMLEEFQMI